MAKREAKTANLMVRMQPSIKARLEKAAEADRRSVASYLEKLLDEHLTAHGFPPEEEEKPAAKRGGKSDRTSE